MNTGLFVTASLLVASQIVPSIAHASEVPPVLDGIPAKVKAVRLVPRPEYNLSVVMATVSYNGICTTPKAFVVVKHPGFKYTVLESQRRGPACMAYSPREAEIEVGTLGNPVPPGVSVNGLPLH